MMVSISAYSFFGVDLVHEISPDNLIQNTITATNSATQLLNQAQQIQMEIQNMKNIQGHETTWSNAQPLLQQLATNAEKGEALAYSMQGMDQQFRQTFPGYVTSQNYQTDYQHWTSSTQDTLRNTLGNAGIQANSFKSEQQQLDEFASMSQSAQGACKLCKSVTDSPHNKWGNYKNYVNLLLIKPMRKLLIWRIKCKRNKHNKPH